MRGKVPVYCICIPAIYKGQGEEGRGGACDTFLKRRTARNIYLYPGHAEDRCLTVLKRSRGKGERTVVDYFPCALGRRREK